MKKHIIIKANKLKPNIKINIDYKTIVFFTLLICGLVIGVLITQNGSDSWQIFFNEFLNKYISSQSNDNYILLFFRFFLPFFTLHLITYIIGLCGVGAPFLSFIPVSLGICFGVIITKYYANYELNGIVFCCLIYLPLYATTAATLIKCCCRCLDISGEIFLYLASGKGEGKPMLKDFTLNSLVMIIPTIIACVISVIFYNLFSELFIFIS